MHRARLRRWRRHYGQRLGLLRDRAVVSKTAREVKARNLTYLSWRSLRQLERAVELAAKADGAFVECGVALGGSAVVICSRMPRDRRFHAYDVFGTIPAPTSPKDDEAARERYALISSGKAEGLGGETYYGYLPDLQTRVRTTLDEFGVADRAELHPGLFEDTLRPEWPIAFAHLDCDWHDPVKLCLDRIYPLLSRGGYVVCDDYYNFGGARSAVDEFLAVSPDMQIARRIMGLLPPDTGTSLVLVRRWPDRRQELVSKSAGTVPGGDCPVTSRPTTTLGPSHARTCPVQT